MSIPRTKGGPGKHVENFSKYGDQIFLSEFYHGSSQFYIIKNKAEGNQALGSSGKRVSTKDDIRGIPILIPGRNNACSVPVPS